MCYAQNAYNELVALGIPKEDAREVLPNACCTKILVSMNIRSMRDFLGKRLIKKAQWQIRTMARLMLNAVKDGELSIFFEDISEKFKE